VLGLYLHIPFCSAICNYCNFNRGLYDAALKARYVDALEAEIRRAGHGAAPDAADTIFLGGGTPSLLEPEEIGRLLAACRESFALAPDAEITLETNPETSSRERMDGFRGAGVNRISFGVQSFRDEELRRLGRIDNISLDLMMWLPQQPRAHWQENVEALIGVGPDHASLYLLELYPNAPLKEDMARAGWSLAPDDDAAAMYLWSLERLTAAGYVQYEISNVSRPERESRHNLKYWTDGEWLGFGCGAHSTREGVRWKNVAGTEDYIARIGAGGSAAIEPRVLTPEERLEEAMFTGLRLSAGVDLEEMGLRHGADVWSRFGPALAPYLAEGLLAREGPRLRLTREGMLVANEIMAVFV